LNVQPALTRLRLLQLWLWLRAESLQPALGLLLIFVALAAVDWRLGIGTVGAVLYLEKYVRPRPPAEGA